MASRPVVVEIPEKVLLAEKTDEVSFGRIDPGSIPSEWLSLDLGAGELAAMALARRTTSVVRTDPGVPSRGRLSTRWHLWANVFLQGEGPAS